MLTRRRPTGDDGVTLIEVMVAGAISMIILAVVTTFFVGFSTFTNTSVLTNQTTADALTTLDAWTALLDAADWFDPNTKTDRFEEITPTKIVFFADLANRNTADLQVAPLTKVVLMLRVTNSTTGDGQLIEIEFKPDNVTPALVRQVAFNASATNSTAVFQPYNSVGGAIDVSNTNGCLQGSTPQPGLCLQSPPAGAGMTDPGLTPGTLTVTQPAQPLQGNPAANVDTSLQNVGGITIQFTVSDPTHRASVAYSSAASVSSGFPS